MNNILEALLSLSVNIDSIKQDPKNARKHPDRNLETIKKSLSAFGQRKPVVVNRNTGHIEAGNGLWQAAKALGWSEIAVAFVNDASEVAQAYGIMDNQSALLAEWDLPNLKDLLQGLDDGETDMSLTGFTTEEIENLMNQTHQGLTDDDEIPEKVETICKTGDLWQLGEHRLLCGDATKKEDVERLMGGERVNLVWTDPPYGVNYGEKLERANPIAHRVRTIKNDDLKPADLESFLTACFKNLADYADKGAAIYVACPPGTPLPSLIASFEGSGFDFRWQLVWVKDQLVLSRADYHFRHENILYGWKHGEAHYFTDDRKQDSVFEVPRPKASDEHPTMKPVLLIEGMVRNSSTPGDIVADTFGGSGSTLIACEKLGRQCRMMELSETYCDVIIQRWQNFTGQTAVKL
jgi:DNA modification methylase